MVDSRDPKVVAIDLGTRNTVVVYDDEIVNVQYGLDITTSSVRCDHGRMAVAEGAIEEGQVDIEYFKRVMGLVADDPSCQTNVNLVPHSMTNRHGNVVFHIDGEEVHPEEVAAILLGTIHHRVEELNGGQACNEAIIAVPAMFSDAQRSATRTAALLGPFTHVRFVDEPVAAVVHYQAAGKLEGAKFILAIDIGAGTSDLSLVRFSSVSVKGKDKKRFIVLATAGNNSGGRDIDAALARFALAKHKKAFPDTSDPTKEQWAKLLEKCEKAKKKLSSSHVDVATITVQSGKPAVEIERDVFENTICGFLRSTIHQLIEETLTGNERCKPTHVVLVGGSSYLPAVKNASGTLLPNAHVILHNPDTSVARGAYLVGTDENIELRSVVPRSIGVEAIEVKRSGFETPFNSVIIKRSTGLPVKSVQKPFFTRWNDQSTLQIKLYEGESPRLEECKHLTSFKLRGIPPGCMKGTKVVVTMSMSKEYVLEAEAEIVAPDGTAIAEGHTFTREEKFSPEEIKDLRERTTNRLRGESAHSRKRKADDPPSPPRPTIRIQPLKRPRTIPPDSSDDGGSEANSDVDGGDDGHENGHVDGDDDGDDGGDDGGDGGDDGDDGGDDGGDADQW